MVAFLSLASCPGAFDIHYNANVSQIHSWKANKFCSQFFWYFFWWCLIPLRASYNVEKLKKPGEQTYHNDQNLIYITLMKWNTGAIYFWHLNRAALVWLNRTNVEERLMELQVQFFIFEFKRKFHAFVRQTSLQYFCQTADVWFWLKRERSRSVWDPLKAVKLCKLSPTAGIFHFLFNSNLSIILPISVSLCWCFLFYFHFISWASK